MRPFSFKANEFSEFFNRRGAEGRGGFGGVRSQELSYRLATCNQPQTNNQQPQTNNQHATKAKNQKTNLRGSRADVDFVFDVGVEEGDGGGRVLEFGEECDFEVGVCGLCDLFR